MTLQAVIAYDDRNGHKSTGNYRPETIPGTEYLDYYTTRSDGG